MLRWNDTLNITVDIGHTMVWKKQKLFNVGVNFGRIQASGETLVWGCGKKVISHSLGLSYIKLPTIYEKVTIQTNTMVPKE